jgi:preprotein translocase subunit SecY|tara:strand:+ start:2156 stop:3358 length:1203 start_codon:yes stop_codon:yes gene_type:complete
MEVNQKDTITKKVLFTIFIIILIRLGNFIPIPNVDQRYLVNILNANPSLKAFFNSETLILSVFSLGIIPNINASILIQLLVSAVPYLEKLQKEEGETGRRQIKQYTRSLTLFIAILESLSIAFSLRPILFNWNLAICGEIVLALTTGSMIILWLSDLITEDGIGNGSSIVITLNILSVLPNTIQTIVQSGNLLSILLSLASFTILIVGIIYVQEAVRIIPLISAKQLFAQQNQNNNQTMRTSYLPLKINQGGVMPIIFSSTFLTFLTIAVNYVLSLKLLPIELNNPQAINLIYGAVNFILIFAFSLFYSNLILNPKEIAKDLNKMAITIPNVRPGKQTTSFLKKTLSRLSLLGALFLAILVAIPNIRSSYGFGVTSLLILVGVTVDTARQIQTLLISKIY